MIKKLPGSARAFERYVRAFQDLYLAKLNGSSSIASVRCDQLERRINKFGDGTEGYALKDDMATEYGALEIEKISELDAPETDKGISASHFKNGIAASPPRSPQSVGDPPPPTAEILFEIPFQAGSFSCVVAILDRNRTGIGKEEAELAGVAMVEGLDGHEEASRLVPLHPDDSRPFANPQLRALLIETQCRAIGRIAEPVAPPLARLQIQLPNRRDHRHVRLAVRAAGRP